jgi:two-component system, NtrC family, nitrogen regulation sensor histidine kinase NtrY
VKSDPRFAGLLAVSAVVCGSLVFLAWHLAVVEQLYATSAVAVVALVAVVLAWAERVASLDRSLASMLSGRDAEPARSQLVRAVLSDSLKVIESHSSSRTAMQIERHQELEQLQALLDTVPAALFVLAADEKMRPVNRSARRFESLEVIGEEEARILSGLRPGNRRIVVLGSGLRYLLLATLFAAPGRAVARLISVQPIAGELDIVELEAWRDMTRVLAHEMMNSLTPIVSLSESLAALVQRAPRSDLVASDIPAAIDALRRRSAGLLDFVQRYRQMSDLPIPVMTPIRLGTFLSELNTLMSSRFSEQGISFSCAPADPDLVVNADRDLLWHAVINLLTNASEAVASVARPVVELSCGRTEDALWLAVRDNGAGIDDAQREQIFVPFYTTKPGGSGVGLSLARQIAVAHGGKLEVKPNFPAGCEFRLTLPLEHSE